VPFEIAESGNDVVADKSAVLRTSYVIYELQNSSQCERIYARVLGIRIFWRCEYGSEGSRFFEGSRISAKFSRPEEVNAGNSRSPRKEAANERVNNVQTNSHRNMLARGCAKASPRHR
jgi:hypothetical protein